MSTSFWREYKRYRRYGLMRGLRLAWDAWNRGY